jgi:two-component system, OmpR family, response regulator VicR
MGIAGSEVERTGRKTVLVVDDSVELLELIRELLEIEGYRVVPCRSADDLLPAVQTERPSLLMLDVRLPGRPPWYVYDLVKSDPATASIPVVVCSAAQPEIGEREERLRGHGTAVVMKPFDIEELVGTVRRLIG